MHVFVSVLDTGHRVLPGRRPTRPAGRPVRRTREPRAAGRTGIGGSRGDLSRVGRGHAQPPKARPPLSSCLHPVRGNDKLPCQGYTTLPWYAAGGRVGRPGALQALHTAGRILAVAHAIGSDWTLSAYLSRNNKDTHTVT